MVRNNRPRAGDLVRLRDEASDFEYKPLVSILLPLLDQAECLKGGLDSVLSQVYPAWELCVCADGSTAGHAREVLDLYERLDKRIKVTYLEAGTSVCGSLNAALSVARGEFVGRLDGGDELASDALFEVVKLLQEYPEADLVYSDEDEVDEEGNRSNPYFKPGWSPELLLCTNYVSHLSIYRRSLLEEIGGYREGFDGCQDYDLVLRATERTDEVHHAPQVLYHRRAGLPALQGVEKGELRDRTRRALSEALERRGLEGSVENGYLPDHFRARPKIRGEPKVSIIIPTRDNVSFLRRCIENIERLTTYRNYELLIVDNNSRDRATVEYLASIPYRVIPFREAFNYSRINNFAVSRAEGEYILLLNDDTEVNSGGWIEAMLEHAQRPEVGAVGAKLLYPDGRIQHAGVIVGVGNPWEPGVAMPSHQFYSSDSPGYAGALMVTTNYSAVTAACMLFRKALFNELGGMEEENLPVQFNDVDLC
jgi:glycosyltransferase involved in cell wall biosynthesis